MRACSAALGMEGAALRELHAPARGLCVRCRRVSASEICVLCMLVHAPARGLCVRCRRCVRKSGACAAYAGACACERYSQAEALPPLSMRPVCCRGRLRRPGRAGIHTLRVCALRAGWHLPPAHHHPAAGGGHGRLCGQVQDLPQEVYG